MRENNSILEIYCDNKMPNLNIPLGIILLVSLISIEPKTVLGTPIASNIHYFAHGHHEGQLHETKTPGVASIWTKFILLTTGEQIKLFPLSFNQNDEVESLNEQDFLLIKPGEFDANDSSTLDRLGRRSPFTKWLQHRHLTRIGQAQNTLTPAPASVANIRQSILPKNRNKVMSAEEQDEHLYEEEHQSGFKWQKPIISKVDYFFSDKYCKYQASAANKCLVVVWLDRANKFVRFGSIDLSEKLLKSSFNHRNTHNAAPGATTAPKRTDNTTLWLHEFPPIDLCRQINATDGNNCEVFDLVIEKRAEKLVVIMGNGQRNMVDGQVHANRILTVRLTSNEHHEQQLMSKSIFIFNEDCSRDFVSQLMNFNFLTSKWLYYLEKAFGGKVIALDVSSNGSDLTMSNKAMHTRQMQVFDVRYNLPIEKVKYALYDRQNFAGQNYPPALAMAMDQANSKLYFLMHDNRLYSSDLIGEDAQYVGQLSAKRVIRSPNAMFVKDGTIYLSDSSRKSLMAYKLPSRADHQDGAVGNTLRPTYQVLLVEMPTISDFRIIDTSDPDEQFLLPCDNDAKATYAELEDDEKLSTCFKSNQIDTHLSANEERSTSYCLGMIFFGRPDGTAMNATSKRTLGVDIANWLMWLMCGFMIYTFLFGNVIQHIRHVLAIIKSMRRDRFRDDMSTIWTTEANQTESEKRTKWMDTQETMRNHKGGF